MYLLDLLSMVNEKVYFLVEHLGGIASGNPAFQILDFILNDVSARDVQANYKQWHFGKSLEGFCPMGPWIVTADVIPAPPQLAIRSYVNGELRQDSNTNLLIFTIPYIIEELSHGITLKAGTIISTGTPAGVGMGFVPPKFLNVGDTVVCEIEKIGTLTNQIVE
jgi:2-keto-4-pentenoate hydratase/2-oxohepta-3-ene-1,7-dioic acid hydratase in catechol pathway